MVIIVARVLVLMAIETAPDNMRRDQKTSWMSGYEGKT